MIKEEYVYEGLGFPVVLKNVKMINIRGVDVPNINFNKLMEHVLIHLVEYKTKLRGSHIFFIRNYLELSSKKFTHMFHFQSVKELSNVENGLVELDWAVEKDIRLHILIKSGKQRLIEDYIELFEEKPIGGDEIIFSQEESKYVV